MDFNEALINKCCELIDIEPNISRTKEFVGVEDLITDNSQLTTYYQVFAQKHEFLQNLSIIDLIFNLGPECILYITKLG